MTVESVQIRTMVHDVIDVTIAQIVGYESITEPKKEFWGLNFARRLRQFFPAIKRAIFLDVRHYSEMSGGDYKQIPPNEPPFN